MTAGDQKHESILIDYSLDIHLEGQNRMNRAFARLFFMARKVFAKGLICLALFIGGHFSLGFQG